MQDLLNQLAPPIAIGLIVLVLAILVGIVFLIRRNRRRRAVGEDLDTTSGTVDYTSLPIEEDPTNWRDRFAQLSLPVKILAILIPLLVALGVLLLVVLLLPNGGTATEPLPTPVPLTITITKADLIRVTPGQVVNVVAATTGIPNDAEVSVEMLENGQPFPWFNNENTTGTVRNNRVEMLVPRAANAPTPDPDATYTVVLQVTTQGETVSGQADLNSTVYANEFFSSPVAAVPQPTSTSAPQEPTPTSVPEATPEPEPSATAAPLRTPGIPATVSNGGNLRRQPFVTGDNVIGQVAPNDAVELLERTPNALWYRIRTPSGDEGWASIVLLNVNQATPERVAVASIVTVFTSGVILDEPIDSGTQVGRINVGEVVELLQKTSDEAWYEVDDIRDVKGWVRAGLLGIPPEIAAQVPERGAQAAAPAGTISSSAPTAATGSAGATNTALEATLATGGNLRSEPEVSSTNVVTQIDADTTVALLEKTADGDWFRVRDPDGTEGWISASLLTVDADVASQVPVAP